MKINKCRICNTELTEENWYPSSCKSGYYLCKNCYHIKNKKYYLKNKEKINERQRKYVKINLKEIRDKNKKYNKIYRKIHHQQLKEKGKKRREHIKKIILDHYSNGTMICKKCGFNDIRALTIDHINGGGSSHRRELRAKGWNFYSKLIKDGYPDDYQVLCMNCQFIKMYENNERRI